MPITTRQQAVAIGRKGGLSRAKKLSTGQRTAIARHAARTRWAQTPPPPPQNAPHAPKSRRRAA